MYPQRQQVGLVISPLTKRDEKMSKAHYLAATKIIICKGTNTNPSTLFSELTDFSHPPSSNGNEINSVVDGD